MTRTISVASKFSGKNIVSQCLKPLNGKVVISASYALILIAPDNSDMGVMPWDII